MLSRALRLCFLLSCSGSLLAAEDEAMVEKVRAAYLYNFALYTEWPERSAEPVTLCVSGRHRLGNALDALAGKLVRGRALSIRQVDGNSSLHHCHMLYLGQMSNGLRTRLLQQLAQRPVLTVAEASDVEDGRIMITLVPDGNRLSFEIDLTAARASGLSLSAKMLHLARNVVVR